VVISVLAAGAYLLLGKSGALSGGVEGGNGKKATAITGIVNPPPDNNIPFPPDSSQPPVYNTPVPGYGTITTPFSPSPYLIGLINDKYANNPPPLTKKDAAYEAGTQEMFKGFNYPAMVKTGGGYGYYDQQIYTPVEDMGKGILNERLNQVIVAPQSYVDSIPAAIPMKKEEAAMQNMFKGFNSTTMTQTNSGDGKTTQQIYSPDKSIGTGTLNERLNQVIVAPQSYLDSVSTPTKKEIVAVPYLSFGVGGLGTNTNTGFTPINALNGNSSVFSVHAAAPKTYSPSYYESIAEDLLAATPQSPLAAIAPTPTKKEASAGTFSVSTGGANMPSAGTPVYLSPGQNLSTFKPVITTVRSTPTTTTKKTINSTVQNTAPKYSGKQYGGWG
jgi:hypothetical protein